MEIPLSIGFDKEEYENVSKEAANEYVHAYSLEGVYWFHNKKKIKIENKDSSVHAYPSVDKKYVIAVYQDQNTEFPMPNNAVIYNLDGSIHKVLEIPELLSEKSKENIAKENHSNPPIEDNRYGHWGLGLCFKGFGWKKNDKGNLFDAISIQYAAEYGEWRILNPKTGEISNLVSDWYQSRAWR